MPGGAHIVFFGTGLFLLFVSVICAGFWHVKDRRFWRNLCEQSRHDRGYDETKKS